jgi:curved DNA-binding protein
MAKRDYYDILGVSRTASQDEIRKAHRKLVRQFHPDVNKNNASATEKFKEVQEAYDVLSDETKRKNFDQFGVAEGPGQIPPGGGDPFEAYRRGQRGRGAGPGARSYTWQGQPGVSVEDLEADGSNGGLGDIFEQIFGGRGAQRPGARNRPAARAPRGNDVEYPIKLTFEQAARGASLNLQVNRDGREQEIKVKVPAGVKDGSRIRMKGQGEQTGGEPGDLFIIPLIQPHAYYRREGLDILLDLPLSMYEAISGIRVEVPTLDGPVTLTVPPGTSSGAKLRIKARGVFRGDEKGDQLVVTRVIVPKGLDDADRKLLEELATKHPVDARADVQW